MIYFTPILNRTVEGMCESGETIAFDTEQEAEAYAKQNRIAEFSISNRTPAQEYNIACIGIERPMGKVALALFESFRPANIEQQLESLKNLGEGI